MGALAPSDDTCTVPLPLLAEAGELVNEAGAPETSARDDPAFDGAGVLLAPGFAKIERNTIKIEC